MKKRPKCVVCASSYGQRQAKHEQITFPTGGSPPPYTGPDLVMRESVPYQRHGYQNGRCVVMGDMAIDRWTWDRESFVCIQYAPYCSSYCKCQAADLLLTSVREPDNFENNRKVAAMLNLIPRRDLS
jgi:hypothetical protein